MFVCISSNHCGFYLSMLLSAFPLGKGLHEGRNLGFSLFTTPSPTAGTSWNVRVCHSAFDGWALIVGSGRVPCSPAPHLGPAGLGWVSIFVALHPLLMAPPGPFPRSGEAHGGLRGLTLTFHLYRESESRDLAVTMFSFWRDPCLHTEGDSLGALQPAEQSA